MSWTMIVNTFAGTAGVLSIAYLGWVAWICVRDLPTNGRVPNDRRTAKRRRTVRPGPWSVEHSR